ncbi:hypothetical protein F3J45_18310 [Pantoea sp. Ap-967]|nr:hypothetical protein [Pantoea sp. Ap-967]
MKRTMQVVMGGASLLLVGMVEAGPNVAVTFKHLGSEDAVLKMVTTNESSTYQVASPKPKATVKPKETISFDVQRSVSPDVNAAMVRYVQGRKTCAFGTTFQMKMLPGGIKQPQWTKTATPSGGANCTATITRTNADYSWAVEFTMN